MINVSGLFVHESISDCGKSDNSGLDALCTGVSPVIDPAAAGCFETPWLSRD